MPAPLQRHILTAFAFFCLALAIACTGCSDDTSGDPDATDSDTDPGDITEDGQPDLNTDVPGDQPVDNGEDVPTDSQPDTGDMESDAQDMPGDMDPDMMMPPGNSSCDPLPAPTGNTVMVTPAEADQLPQIVRDAESGTTILLADGTYTMTAGDEGSRRLRFLNPNVTLRSASDNAEAVVIDGEYNTNEMIFIQANDVTIAHITVRRAENHPIHVTPTDGTDNVTGVLLYGLRIFDGGEQFVKINANGARTAYVDSGEVACSHFEMTDEGRPNVERAGGGCYTGGIDAHGARGWVVRDNTFEGIYCAGEGLAEHAIHFWTGSRDTLVERNVIRNCARGIGFGLRQDGERRIYPDDPGIGHIGHWDGIIRNNIIWSNIDYHDTGVELNQAYGVRVLNNTVWNDGGNGFYSSIDTRFANTDAVLRNNLARRISNRNGASPDVDGTNLEDVDPGIFMDPAGGNLHLQPGSAPVNAGTTLSDVSDDVDGELRDDGMPDIGADEVVE